MLARLMLLFVTVPLAELALLVWVGGKVGLLPTVALVVGTGILGAALARWQGIATFARFRATWSRGEMPHGELLEGLLILVAAAVLLTPGLLTDLTGFLLLVPALRRRVAARLLEWGRRRRVVTSPGDLRDLGGFGAPPPSRPGPADSQVLDVDFKVEGSQRRPED